MRDEGNFVPFQASALPALQGPWLVFAPHADDETFGMGGTLALAQQAGLETHLAVLTDGALGGNQADLVATRQREALAAAQVLGIRSTTFFEQPDRGLYISAALLERVCALLRSLQPRAVFFPGPQELHPDHRVCALLVWEALCQLEEPALQAISYEIIVQSPANCLVDITAVMPHKRQAMAVYHSQLAERDYEEAVEALNRLRSLTLAPEVRWAEAFYCFSPAERQGSLAAWLQARTSLLLQD